MEFAGEYHVTPGFRTCFLDAWALTENTRYHIHTVCDEDDRVLEKRKVFVCNLPTPGAISQLWQLCEEGPDDMEERNLGVETYARAWKLPEHVHSKDIRKNHLPTDCTDGLPQGFVDRVLLKKMELFKEQESRRK